jgi:hypothetical protein
MIIELLTPLMLATAPIRIDVAEPKYDHQSQKNIRVAEWSDLKQITFNGTQTFNYKGQPNDSDND